LGKYRCIHVAGTNGKGSLANYIANILMAAGNNVGLFTSPHLLKWQERIQVNGENIDLTDDFEQKLYKNGYFISTLKIAHKHFDESDIDYAIIEAGIGGRHDATMEFDADISVISTVAKDHMDILGKKLTDIAYQKAGIIRDTKKVYSFFQKLRVKHVLNEEAYKKRTSVTYLKKDHVSNIMVYEDKQMFELDYKGKIYNDIVIDNPSRIQIYNAALAFIIALDEGVDEQSIRNGLAKKIHCRTEVIDNNVVLDVAHNYNSFVKLVEMLKYKYPNRKFNYMIAMQNNKDIKKVARLINKTANRVFLVDMEMDNFFKPKDISNLFKNPHYLIGTDSQINKSYDYAYKKTVDENSILVVGGSFYLTGKVYSLISSE